MQEQCIFFNLPYSVRRDCATLAFEKDNLGASKQNHIEPTFFAGNRKFEEYLPFVRRGID
jgi:hypothetical protein